MRLRDKVLREIRPGTVRETMVAPHELCGVAGGDHGVLVSKKELKAAGETQEQVDHRILKTIAQFIEKQQL